MSYLNEHVISAHGIAEAVKSLIKSGCKTLTFPNVPALINHAKKIFADKDGESRLCQTTSVLPHRLEKEHHSAESTDWTNEDYVANLVVLMQKAKYSNNTYAQKDGQYLEDILCTIYLRCLKAKLNNRTLTDLINRTSNIAFFGKLTTYIPDYYIFNRYLENLKNSSKKFIEPGGEVINSISMRSDMVGGNRTEWLDGYRLSIVIGNLREAPLRFDKISRKGFELFGSVGSFFYRLERELKNLDSFNHASLCPHTFLSYIERSYKSVSKYIGTNVVYCGMNRYDMNNMISYVDAIHNRHLPMPNPNKLYVYAPFETVGLSDTYWEEFEMVESLLNQLHGLVYSNYAYGSLVTSIISQVFRDMKKMIFTVVSNNLDKIVEDLSTTRAGLVVTKNGMDVFLHNIKADKSEANRRYTCGELVEEFIKPHIIDPLNEDDNIEYKDRYRLVTALANILYDITRI